MPGTSAGIPVFEGARQNIIGVLYAKDLILVDPDDHIEIGTVLTFRQAHVLACVCFCPDQLGIPLHQCTAARLMKNVTMYLFILLTCIIMKPG